MEISLVLKYLGNTDNDVQYHNINDCSIGDNNEMSSWLDKH